MNLHDKPRKIRRKITKDDVNQMAKLQAKRITEVGACLMLGIRYQTWANWKSRNQHGGKFQECLEHARESRLDGIIEAIDKAGESTEVITKNGTKYTRPGDWRARAWIAERVLAPERFADRASTGGQGQGQVNVQVNLMLEGIAKVFAGQAGPPSQAIEHNPPGQLPDKSQVVDIIEDAAPSSK